MNFPSSVVGKMASPVEFLIFKRMPELCFTGGVVSGPLISKRSGPTAEEPQKIRSTFARAL